MIERVFVLLLLLPGIFGWGKEGHYVICKIAEEYLSEDAVAGIKELLPENAEGELANVCSWADEVKHHYHYRWSSPLHYVDTPDFSCNYRYCRDCHDYAGHKDRCVTGAIYNYTTQLISGFYGSDSEITCFIGDEGGNTIIVRWYRRKTNLHHVWDNMIIESALKTFYNSNLMTMIQAIQHNITDDWISSISSWENCNTTVCPDPYASESVNLACKFAYRNATPGSTLGDDYFFSRWPVVEERLSQAGVRLAAALNRIFASKLPIANQ